MILRGCWHFNFNRLPRILFNFFYHNNKIITLLGIVFIDSTMIKLFIYQVITVIA